MPRHLALPGKRNILGWIVIHPTNWHPTTIHRWMRFDCWRTQKKKMTSQKTLGPQRQRGFAQPLWLWQYCLP
jgi:hypothetical protein